MKHRLSILYSFPVVSFFPGPVERPDAYTCIKTNYLERSKSSRISENRIWDDRKLSCCCQSPALFRVSPTKTAGTTAERSHLLKRTSITKPPYPFHKISVQKAASHLNTRFKIDLFASYASFVKLNCMEKLDNTGITGIYGPTAITDKKKQVYGNVTNLTNNPCHSPFISSTTFAQPQVKKFIFSEYDHTCNHPFIKGIYAHTSGGTNVIPEWRMNLSENWNKICVYLTPC